MDLRKRINHYVRVVAFVEVAVYTDLVRGPKHTAGMPLRTKWRCVGGRGCRAQRRRPAVHPGVRIAEGTDEWRVGRYGRAFADKPVIPGVR